MLRDPDSVFHATPNPVATPVRVCSDGDTEKEVLLRPGKTPAVSARAPATAPSTPLLAAGAFLQPRTSKFPPNCFYFLPINK